jgi:hypothetical protein
MLSGRGRALAPGLDAAAAAVALGLFTLRARWSGQLTDQGLAPFSRMIDGTAARPFVHRLLLPSVARGLRALLPGSPRHAPAHAAEVALALLLVFVCFLAFAFVLRRLLDACYAAPDGVRRWAPAVALLALPAFFLPSSVQLYDPATLLLTALGMLLILERRRTGYYAVFVLACLNRETAILLTGLFLLWECRHLRRSRLAWHIVAQVILWGGVQAAIRALHTGNPGHEAQLLFPHNLRLLITPRAAIPFWGLLALSLALVVPGWKRAPRFLRQALLVMLVPVAVGTLLAGLPTEMRDYLEAYPALVLLALPTAAAWLTRERMIPRAA